MNNDFRQILAGEFINLISIIFIITLYGLEKDYLALYSLFIKG